MKKLLFVLCIILLPRCLFANGFAVSSSGLTTATVTVVSTQIVPADSLRNYLIIQNNGTTNVIVKFGSAQTGTEGIVIPPGGNYEPFKGFIDSVWMRSASSTDSVTVQEGH